MPKDDPVGRSDGLALSRISRDPWLNNPRVSSNVYGGWFMLMIFMGYIPSGKLT